MPSSQNVKGDGRLKPIESTRVAYLNMLPTELWEKILFEAAMSEEGWLFLPSSEEPLYIRRNSNIVQLRHAQSRRAKSLRGLCKALLPIMEAVLYSHPIITSKIEFKSFIQGASAPRVAGRPRGFWTICFVYDPDGRPLTVQGLEERLSTEDLYQLSIHCPGMRHMELRDLDGQLGAPHSFTGLIIFLQLRCLVFPQAFLQQTPSTAREHLNVEHDSMPNLQYLHITPKESILQSYIDQFGQTLTTLELSHIANLEWLERSPKFPKNLFQLCPHLTNFGFPFEEMAPIPRATPFTPFQPLTSLVLFANSTNLRRFPQKITFGIHLAFFTDTNFPNVKRVEIVLYDRRHKQELIQIAERIFSNASVNTRTINT